MRDAALTPRRVSGWTAGPVALFLLLVTSPASAQDPVVTAADPPSAEQETYDLEVTVSGDNFAKDSDVRFLVTGTENPGGIHVKSVKAQGPKTLKVTIDVALDAVVNDFDIEVKSRGRTGKGIELFRVIEKVHPVQDTTPPGEILDLEVLEERYGSVFLSFTMPADDGYDAASGPVAYCVVRGGEMGSQECTEDWGQPGETQMCIVRGLAPETGYNIRVNCRDDAENWSPEATIPVTTGRFADFKDPSWTIEEVPYGVDGLLGHAFDAQGNVVITGMVGLWDQWSSNGKPSLVPTVIRIITGVQGETGWSWSSEDVPGFANRLLMDPWGHPAFVGQRYPDRKAREEELTFVFHDGSGWVTEVVATTASASSPPGFAFDPVSHQPAIAWCSPGSPAGVRLARRSSAGVWDVDTIASSCQIKGSGSQAEIAYDGAGEPVVLYRDRLGDDGPYEVRLLRESGSSWTEEIVRTNGKLPPYGVGSLPGLVYDPYRGDFTTAREGEEAWKMEVCDRTGSSWSCDARAFWGGLWYSRIPTPRLRDLGSDCLAADTAGEIVVAYSSEAETDATIARRLPGQPTWTIEHVDHPTEHGLPAGVSGDDMGTEGPYLALDPLGLPTLTYAWNPGMGNFDSWSSYPPAEYHLYFARKP